VRGVGKYPGRFDGCVMLERARFGRLTGASMPQCAVGGLYVVIQRMLHPLRLGAWLLPCAGAERLCS
jgi:hypothetical protein